MIVENQQFSRQTNFKRIHIKKNLVGNMAERMT